MALRFGTDGVRARADTVLTESVVRALGRAAAGQLGADVVVIGHDTRASGEALSRALAEGFLEGGVEVRQLGMAPTPAVAHAAAVDGIAGAVVSGSHNPWTDNGVKLFAAGGHKLDDAAQVELQASWDETPGLDASGRAVPEPVSDDRWAEAVASSVDAGALVGLALVVDCAHGAMSTVAPVVLEHLGAEVTVLNATPDGRNINHLCGSMHPEGLQRAVVDAGADAGLAFDGDGDRVAAVGADGALLDGDHLLAACGIDLHERGLLADDTVVGTVMANLGLRRAFGACGISFHETAVGDRYVLEALEANGWTLGGEQSGHLIFRHLATTGDGLLAGIQALDAARRRGRTLGEWATELVVKAPQVLRAVAVEGSGEMVVEAMADDIATAGDLLGDEGRVVVRPSGTESVVRVMVEALDAELARRLADELCAAAQRIAGRDAGSPQG
jgi:phosphoglucosamine mutase|tara:strand:+ start:9889 stop:11223 length:1335 start_codon:yes stop_codon:yes gene_type:complete